MPLNKFVKKLYTIFFITTIIFSGFFFENPFYTMTQSAKALSEWKQEFYEEFENGTFHNISIRGIEENFELRLSNISGIWTKKSLSPSPKTTPYNAMEYINGTDNIILFGGSSGSTSLCNETWEYDLSNDKWTNKKATNYPVSIEYAMAPIWNTDKILILGGQKFETYVYDQSNNKWTKMNPSKELPAQNWRILSTVWGTDKILSFGGYLSSETWVYDYSDNRWTRIFPKDYPEIRMNPDMAPILGTDKVLLFGGLGTYNNIYYNDTWIYDLSDNNWKKITTSSRPQKRYMHALASIWGTEKVLLFGGFGFNKTKNEKIYFDDTWLFDFGNNSWHSVASTIKPSGRFAHLMATICRTNKVLLYGGYSLNLAGGNYVNETWMFSLNDYRKYTNGTYSSAPFDTRTNSFYKTLSWSGNTSENTSMKFQLRTASTKSGLFSKSFVGPDGNKLTYYNLSKSVIWNGHNDDRWIQYKVYLGTINANETPVLRNVTITYNNLPLTLLFKPSGQSISSNNKPRFIWNFTDFDSTNQEGFQLLISNESDFNRIIYTSGNQSTSTQQWQFPNGTNYTNITDGRWYWKVRTMDADGDWGAFSETRELIIDTKLPTSKINSPENKGIYNKLHTLTGTAADPYPSSGLNKVEIIIQRRSDNYYWDGTQWKNGETWLKTAGTGTWTYDTFFVKWTSGGYYSVRSRSVDNASNYESLGLEKTFLIDYDIPISTIEYPFKNSFLNNLNEIQGNAYDSGGSELAKVEICIIRSSDNYFWNGSAWVPFEPWLEAEGTYNWSYNCSQVVWYSGINYLIRSKAYDNAKNIEPTGIGIVFTIDLKKPTSYITSPINNSQLNNLKVISGTAADNEGSGLAGVEVCIIQESDNNYWDGSGWSASEKWLQTDGTTEWIYDSVSISWNSGTKYKIFSRAKDIAGNVEDPDDEKHFSIDLEHPYSIIESPINKSFLKELNHISGVAGDTGKSGLAKVQISIISLNDTKYWTGIEWSSKVNWLNVEGKTNWDYNTSGVKWSTDTRYRIISRSFDNAGNSENSINGISFTFDSRPPERLQIKINEGNKYTNTRDVRLLLNAEDSCSGVSEMAFSSDGKGWSTWFDFETTTHHILEKEDGSKRVYFKVKDKAGNIAEPVIGFISLDTTPPENVWMSINENNEYTNSNNVNLNLNAVDNLSGIGLMSFSTDGELWTPGETYSTGKQITLIPGDGEKTVFFNISDNAGNTVTVFDSIILDTTPPESLTLLINNGASVTNSTSVSLNVGAIDSLSGVHQMSFSIDGKQWSDWENYSGFKTFTLPGDDGDKVILFRVNDRAGNIADPVANFIVLYSKPKINIEPDKEDHPVEQKKVSDFNPAFPLLIVVIIVLIIIFSFVYYHKKRKQKFEEEKLRVQHVKNIKEITRPTRSIFPVNLEQPVLINGQVPPELPASHIQKVIGTDKRFVQTPKLPPSQANFENLNKK